MYNSVHCVTNCIEEEKKFKHKNDSYVQQPLYSIVASKHDSYACGNGFEPYDDTMETAVYPY